MNDYEAEVLKQKMERLDALMRILVAKECNCMACLLKGCDCCENKRDVNDLVEQHLEKEE